MRRHAAAAADMMPMRTARFVQSNRRVTKLLRPLVNRMLPNREMAVRVRYGAGQGLRLFIYPRNEKFYWTGLHEIHVQQAMQRELEEGSVFWDVGAHIGFSSLIASRLVGPSGRVESFEPYPPNQRRLAASMELNGCTNVTVHSEALSSQSGQRSFYLHESSLMGSLVEHPSEHTMDIPCITLEEAAQRLAVPNLIKIDAEGAELDVLCGGKHFLAVARPKLIVEFTTSRLLNMARDLFPFYATEHLGQNHWLFRAAAE
jgi:FkbM family methyltransferase